MSANLSHPLIDSAYPGTDRAVPGVREVAAVRETTMLAGRADGGDVDLPKTRASTKDPATV